MNLELRNLTLDSVTIEYTVAMQLSDEYFIRIESPFTLVSANQSIRLSPEEDSTEAFEPLRDLLGRVISESTISDTGTLSVIFEGGVRLLAEPDSQYEAWTVSGPNGMLIVCMPGGELALWGTNTAI